MLDLYDNSTEEIFWNLFLGEKWLRKGSLHSNIPTGTGGIDHLPLPLTYCLHTFQVQNYSFLHLYLQFKQDLPIQLPDLIAIWVVHLPSHLDILHLQVPWCLFDSNLIPSSSSPFYTESSVVEDLSVRSTAQSVLPLQIDWYVPSRPSTSYMVSTQSNFTTSTSSYPQSGVQRFFQEFRLPDYTLDSFSGRLLDVVSSMTFSSGDVQAELCHAITRLMVFTCVFETLIPFY